MELIPSDLLRFLHDRDDIHIVYLFGSRAEGGVREDSDYDLGILFADHLSDSLEAHLRPELLKQDIERTFHLISVDVVDGELAPLALQEAIIRGKVVFSKDLVRSHRFENMVLSKLEKGV
jgi:predicted nucleotidyltransferase